MTATYKNNLEELRSIVENITDYGQHHIPRPQLSKLIHPHTDHSIHHWGRPYPTQMNLLNLSYIEKAESLDSAPFFLVRDGILLTLDFFNRCHKKPDLRSILLFHHEMRDYIPNEWDDNVLFYEYAYTPKTNHVQFSNNKSKRMILKFHIMNSCFSPEKIISVLEKFDHYEEIILCFSIHETNYFLSDQWDGGLFLHSTYELLENVKQKCLEKADKVSTMTLKQLQSINDLSEFDFFNAGNFEQYYVDDFTNHHCILSGAIPLLTEKMAAHSDDVVFPLSFNKDIRVLATPAAKDPKKLEVLRKGLDAISINPGEKFNISAFQLAHSLTKEHTNFSWPKNFYIP